MKVSQTLRRLVRDGGLSGYEICHRTGIDKATLSRFANGRKIRSDAVDALAELFKLELTPAGYPVLHDEMQKKPALYVTHMGIRAERQVN